MNTPNFRVTTDLHASKGQRIGNLVIDYIARIVIGGGIGAIIGVISVYTDNYELLNSITEGGTLAELIAAYIIIVIYYSIIESFNGRSIGKYITKTKVVMEDGTQPKPVDIVIRSLCRLIPFNIFSFLGDDTRGWHDSMSETYVVDIEKFEAKRTTQGELDLIGQPIID